MEPSTLRHFSKSDRRRPKFMKPVLLGLCVIFVSATSDAAISDLTAQLENARADGQVSSQIEIIRRILAVDQENDALRSELIDLWFLEGDYDMAELTLNDWKSAPEEKSALTTAKILVERDENPKSGITLLEAFLSTAPESLPVTEALAKLLRKENKNERLAGFLQESPLTTSQPGLLILRAQAKRDLGKFELAMADAALAKSLDPKNELVVGTLASFDRLAVAAPDLSAADDLLQTSPTDLQALISRSYWKQYAGLPQTVSHHDAEVALLAHPDSAAAKISFARTSGLNHSENLKQFSVDVGVPELNDKQLSSLAALDLAVAESANPADSLSQRAVFLNDVALQYLLALADADAALALEPSSHLALQARLTSLVRLGRTNLAASAFNSLEASKPSKEIMASALRTFADAEFARGENTQALGTVNRALKLQRTPAALKIRAAIYQRLEMTNEAKADLDLAATLEKSPKR